ncbi:MAG: glycosyl hydrolase-related protein [bacterium]|nr:glycosyl hydrolase-related protein [bacterium]
MPQPRLHLIPFSRLHLFRFGDPRACLSRGRQTIARVLELMEGREDLTFVVENVAFASAYLEAHPSDIAKVQHRLQEGRLEVSPQWTAVDQNFAVGEDLVRNLYYGREWLENRSGQKSQVLFFSKTSGWTPQFPQLVRKSGMAFVAAAGSNGFFDWVGLDGSRVVVWNPELDLDVFWQALQGEPGIRKASWKVIEDALVGRDGILPIFWGSDLSQLSEAALGELDELGQGEDVAVGFGRLGEVFKNIPAPLSQNQGEVPSPSPYLETLAPEMVCQSRKGVYTLLWAEQVAAISHLLCQSPYPQEQLREAWLRQLEGMDYDVGGNTDSRSALQRQVDSLSLVEDAESLIAAQVAVQEGPPGTIPIVVFNPCSWERTDVVTARVVFWGEEAITDFGRYELCRLVDGDGEGIRFQEVSSRQVETTEIEIVFLAKDVPACGYATYYLLPNTPQPELLNVQVPGMMAPEFPEPTFAVEDVEDRISEPLRGIRIGRRFSTSGYLLDVDEVTGWVTLTDRKQDRVLIKDLRVIGFEESMKMGVEHFDPTGRQFELALDRVDLIESGEVRATLLLEGHLLHSKVDLRFDLYDGLDRVDLKVGLAWRDEKPVSVDLIFDSGMEDARVHYGVPFGFSSPDQARCVCASWASHRQCLGWVALDDGETGMVIATDRAGFKFEKSRVQSTLLRSWIDPISFSYRRVWRAYPERVVANYSIRGYSGDFRSARSYRDGWELNQPLRSCVTYDTDAPRSLPDRVGPIVLDGEGVVTTALKQAEDGDGFILRAFEALGEGCEARLKTWAEILSVSEVDLMEQPVREVAPEAIVFAPFEIKTLRLKLGVGA